MTTPSDWVHDDNTALFTDLYQLTMLQAYFAEGMDEEAVFDLFVRRLKKRNYLIACGLETCLRFLETLRFTDEDIAYLATLGLFQDDFLAYLADFRFTGDVYALPEGTPVFPNEPLLEVVAPIGQAQLVETFLLNQITFQTNLATKAHRVVHAAQGRLVADFGMRRMHAGDAALKAARASYIAGVGATSNVLAGRLYGIPALGTMAHSYIEAHDVEAEAFRAFAALYPKTTLLVDTYDTLGGVRQLIALSQEHGDAFRPGAIRLDSGDLADLATQARHLLDDAGLTEVKIFASSSLDEYKITALLDRGAPIDGFGVGTQMGTIADRPYLDSVYKLVEYAGQGRMKLSTNKTSVPGRKQLFRVYENGKAVRDTLALHDEALEGTPLLACVMKNGQRTSAGSPHSLDALRTHTATSTTYLADHLLALAETDTPYPVTLSTRLSTQRDALRKKVQRSRFQVQGSLKNNLEPETRNPEP